MYTQKPYYLGIDLHKRTSTWVLIDDKFKVIESKQLPVEKMLFEAYSDDLKNRYGVISSALEPVCGWRWCRQTLLEKGMKVTISHPYKTKLITNSKQKTDKNDATKLAELLKVGYLPSSYVPNEDIHLLRRIVRDRSYLVRMRTGLSNRIHSILTQEGITYAMSDLFGVKGRTFIASLNKDYLNKLLIVRQELSSAIRSLECKLEKFARNNPIVSILRTMPAIGVITASTIYAEVADFSRFKTPKHLVSFAGLAPSEHSSGDSVCRGHITKQGSKYLRASLVEAAFRIRSTTDHYLYSFFEKSSNNLSFKRKGRVALARKMLVIMWYMVKNKTSYIPSTERNTTCG